jgi:hypothetical protein
MGLIFPNTPRVCMRDGREDAAVRAAGSKRSEMAKERILGRSNARGDSRELVDR